ncbi:PTS sugar transporter subunit IIA [Marinilactibacillus piezotolerans]|uniref:PTS sugar transporter subunit IIA n=1 Tax=Marinilactibacillus piezotolerans TaxID=258723 RepID=UPI0009B18CB0|nr:PTS sugar transporter subunit IIA [Marinilactibacillus piezotolerans]
MKEKEIVPLEMFVQLSFPNAKRNKLALFEEVAAAAADHLKDSVSAAAIVSGLKEREALSTTGFGNGFAIPHGKIAGLQYPMLAVFRLKNPIDWEALDDQMVSHLFIILVPENDAEQTHLKLLSKLSYELVNQEVQEQIRQIKNEAEMTKWIESVFQNEEK